MLEPAGKIGHVIASPIQQQYNFLLLEKVSKMLSLLNSCEVADFWILSCAGGIYVIVWRRLGGDQTDVGCRVRATFGKMH